MTALTINELVPAARPRRRPPVLVMIALLIITSVIILAIFGSWLAPQDPAQQDPLLGVTGPGPGHPFGTDQLGRDVLSRLIVATRAALIGPLVVAVGCVLIGGSLGLAGAYFGGAVDAMANRFADLVYALPALLIAIVVTGVVDGGYWTAAAILTLLSVPYQIRISRSVAQVQVQLPYVDAARTLRLPARQIIVRHIVPNVMPTLVTTLLLDFVGALVGFSALAYLGLGVPVGQPDWGSMLAEGQGFIDTNPWLSLATASMIIATAVSVTLVGDWLYDRISREGGAR